MMQDEDELLVEALGAVGGGLGHRGAGFAAKRLKKNVHEIDLRLPLAFEGAVERVHDVLAAVGSQVDPVRPEPSTDRRTIRVITGGEAGATSVLLRAAAKEGLIKQRAGEKTAKRIAGLLAE